MSKMKASLLIASILFVVSCGKEELRSSRERFTGESYGEAFLLKSSEKSCLNSLSFTNRDKIYFSEYLNGRKSDSFENYVAVKSNQRQIFNYLYKKSKFSFYKKYNSDYNLISSNGYVDSEGETFSLCPEYSYDKEEGTFESAAASVVGILSRFQDFMSHASISLPTRKLNLYLSPEMNVYSKYPENETGVKETMINNAFYDSKNSMIAFLPQGVSRKGSEIPYRGIPLWSIPFVPVHEYAHHIFSSNVTSFRTFSETKKNVNHMCFGKIASSNASFDTHSHHDGLVSDFDVYSALNEGFADLVAFYSNVEDGRAGLNMVTCFEKNRDVDSDKFFNGVDKIFGEEEVNKFLKKSGNPFGTCEMTVDYSSIHTVGALFANSFYRLSQELKLDNKTSLKVLIRWTELVGKLESNYSKKSTTSSFIILLKELEKSLLEITKKTSLCQSMQKSFPILYLENNNC